MSDTQKKLNWQYVIFMWFIILGGLGSLTYYISQGQLILNILYFAIVYGIICGLTGSLGYHRYYTHRSYKIYKPWIEWYFAIFGAGMYQGPISQWVTDHRRHHGFPDTEQDPYSITKGAWWAHLGWLMYRVEPVPDADLMRNPVIAFQDKYFYSLSAFMGFVIPAVVGYFLGDGWQGFWIAGVVRVMLTQHGVLFINSVGHTFGSRKFGPEESARDNLFIAIWALGEGYHNFHHTYPGDWRAGIRWFDIDLTKWTLMFWRKMGWAGEFKESYPPKEPKKHG